MAYEIDIGMKWICLILSLLGDCFTPSKYDSTTSMKISSQQKQNFHED